MKTKRKNYTCIRLTDYEQHKLNMYLMETDSGQKSVEIRRIFLNFLNQHFSLKE